MQPVHNGASNEIKEIEVWKKCPKVKPYCTPIFDLIMFKAFLDDAKLPKFCAKCFSLSKSQILGVFFGFVCEKTWRAGQIDLKLGMQKLWILFWKKPENNNFIPAALHCEFDIWNIQIFSKYFYNLDQGKNSWIPFFKGSGQLVPFTWFTSFPQLVWTATDSLAILIAAAACLLLVPTYKLKMELQST